MKRLMLAALITAFAAGSAMAQSCETKAVSKDGKPLAGAAKTSFVTKCKEDTCTPKAVSKPIDRGASRSRSASAPPRMKALPATRPQPRAPITPRTMAPGVSQTA